MSRTVASPILIQTSQPLPPVSRLLVSLALVALRWEILRKTRKDLSRLDAHMLRDIGMDRWHAEAEADKPFWRL